jgi:hypothetical protein
MDNAVWLATIIGPLLTVVGLWAIIFQHDVLKVWQSMKSTPSAFYMSGTMNLLVGLTVLSLYNEWSKEIAVLITLFGWVLVVRGLLAFFFPHTLMRIAERIAKGFQYLSFLLLVWGLALVWFAWG